MKKIIGLFVVLCGTLSCKDTDTMEYEKYLVNGELMYQQKCANCHGAKGEGLRDLYPPLANNEHLKDTEHIICIIKNGASGKIEVNGKTYDQAMPANPKIFNLDIAQLSTYLNKAFLDSDVMVKVAEVEQSLENCK